jgi:hypothetical protein
MDDHDDADHRARCRLILENMANTLDETRLFFYHNHRAGPGFEVAKSFANLLREEPLLSHFDVGPFGGMTRVAQLLAHSNLEPTIENVEGLTDLVWIAREIPAGEKITSDCEPASAFRWRFEFYSRRLGWQTPNIER